MRSRTLFLLWKRHVFVRNRHPELNVLIARHGRHSGIYLIGCAGRIVYVGQSVQLQERPIQSLGLVYHQVPDTSLPWSIAFAPCPRDEMPERESSAIRHYAPKFNTSIPSRNLSNGRLPEIAGVAAVFHDQGAPCGAFNSENLARQAEWAATTPEPRWARKRTRRSSAELEKERAAMRPLVSQDLPIMTPEELVREYGVPADGPLPLAINLCTDGTVVTRDGEILGVWTMDENAHPSFTPDGASDVLFFHPFIGLLCERILEWHEGSSGADNRL